LQARTDLETFICSSSYEGLVFSHSVTIHRLPFALHLPTEPHFTYRQNRTSHTDRTALHIPTEPHFTYRQNRPQIFRSLLSLLLYHLLPCN